MKKIILASGSPRRVEILKGLGANFQIIPAEIEEKTSLNLSPESLAMSLSFMKAYSVGSKYPDEFVLGADTIVELEGKILGKPKDKDEARKFLQMLSGNGHRVITGFTIISINENIKIADFEVSIVTFKALQDLEIEEYISTEEPYDKAGGYAIQGMAKKFIESYSGCYNNIVGLPDECLKKYLVKIGAINV
ncbi:MAG: septum formation protein Maf [Tissierellia bacterium]|nr:septum formation protein Maf [Tissierellia bacterium]